MGSGWVQPKAVSWNPLPVGSPPAGGPKGSGAKIFGWQPKAGTLAVQSRLQKLALGTWNVISHIGKVPELVREVEKFSQDKVGLTAAHCKGS